LLSVLGLLIGVVVKTLDVRRFWMLVSEKYPEQQLTSQG